MGEGRGVFRDRSKKNETIAELTYWYGIDVGSLPKERQHGLLANLRRVQSQERIFRELYNPLDYEGMYELYLDAYGDEELAEAAKLSAIKSLVRRDTEAARSH